MLNLPDRLGMRLNGAQFANLHTFLAVARHLSFSQAAQELCLTASAVSHRIARLEQALALRLFERLTRRIRLTAEGERLYQVLQGFEAQLQEALQPLTTQVSGALSLYVRPSVAQHWLVPRLADFQQRYPQLSLDIRTGNDPVDFRTRPVDLALLYGHGEFPGLVSRLLMDEQIAPVCSPQYAERHGLIGHPERLAQCTLLHDALAWEHAAFDAEWQRWAREQNLQQLLPASHLTFDRSDLCSAAARHHAGVAMGRQRLVQPLLDQGALILPLGGFSQAAGQGYYLVHPPREPLAQRVRVMVEWLRECALS
ncbi:DNA-binding transcriptional regulator DsdC [Pseudomonas donghuensis]|uniref:DNA-binding transcriptional regulator DsdC n=1 Tax=Pseudomonas donghuensis TaxID=1163398 RepID=A0AAP0SIJ1_9PSED|nr:DNA-binding transcriptional regulator DsdC [Pseudomonas donghuensis]KDO00447.1 DNA-binding transcriptional regulator DsdC [Pseudomonas donghuensis]MCP6693776.1 DNA-binding transcriptional regulator DsdC [Pseudomonas donghuensis]MDF9893990.1 LysR family D-serine deaminase transcriptional activator [Pseudomonas vranovensis]